MLLYTPELLDDPVFQASELRAEGRSWLSTAATLEMEVIDLRKLIFADFPKWKRLENEAIRNFFRETNLEAINHSRKHMRGEDVKASVASAGHVLRFNSNLYRHRGQGRVKENPVRRHRTCGR